MDKKKKAVKKKKDKKVCIVEQFTTFSHGVFSSSLG
jgi:hypothetical protein